MYTRLLEPDQISYTWWLREATQIGQTFIPLCEKSRLKHSTAKSSNRSSNFGCNWASFHNKKRRRRPRRPETGDFLRRLTAKIRNRDLVRQLILVVKSSSHQLKLKLQNKCDVFYRNQTELGRARN